MKFPIEVYKQATAPTLYILVFVVDLCNYQCWYCYNHMPRSSICIDFQSLLRFMRSVRQQTTAHIDLNIIGGEPTLYSKLLEFLMRCYDEIPDISIYVITNLSALTAYYLDFYKISCKFTASFHAQHAKHDFYDKVQQLAEYNLIKDVIVMCDPQLFDASIQAYKRLQSMANNMFKVELDMVDGFSYTSDQNYIIGSAVKNKLEYTVKYSDGSNEKKAFTDIANNTLFCFRKWLCNAGKDMLYVHCDGTIYPCESYFSEKLQPLGHIASNMFKLPTSSRLCKCKICSGDFNIYKKNVFGSHT